MPTIFRGTLYPQLQRKQIVYSPVSGFSRHFDYKGFSEQLMLNLMNTFTAQGCEVTFGGEHGVFTLQVRDSTGEVTLDTWQLVQQDERPSCLENPRNIANTNASEREIIKRAISGNITPEESIAQLEAATGDIYGTLGTYAERLYNRMKDSTTEFVRSVYVLRHSTNAPAQYYAPNICDLNVDCIYTTSHLLTETQNAGYWLLPLPPQLAYAINTLAFPAVRSNYLNGWLKRGSSRSTSANFRLDITTEYWAGQISTDEYDTAT